MDAHAYTQWMRLPELTEQAAMTHRGPTQPLTRSQQRIQDAMVALLARAGIGYRGGFVDLSDGLRVHYLDYGPSDAPAVMLIHGGGAGAAVWYRQIAALSRRFRVIAPDNPLFGLSTQTVIKGPVRDFAVRYLTTLMDALGLKRAMLAGLSAGGLAAISLCVRHPERVSRLAVLDAAGLGRELPWVLRVMTLPGVGYLPSHPGKRTHDLFFSTWEVARPGGPDSEVYRRYSYEIMRQDGHGRGIGLTAREFAGLRGQKTVIADRDLASVRVPALVIWGERDRFFPLSHARRAFERIPDSRLHILPGAGHVTPWDASERVTDLLMGFFEDGA